MLLRSKGVRNGVTFVLVALASYGVTYTVLTHVGGAVITSGRGAAANVVAAAADAPTPDDAPTDAELASMRAKLAAALPSRSVTRTITPTPTPSATQLPPVDVKCGLDELADASLRQLHIRARAMRGCPYRSEQASLAHVVVAGSSRVMMTVTPGVGNSVLAVGRAVEPGGVWAPLARSEFNAIFSPTYTGPLMAKFERVVPFRHPIQRLFAVHHTLFVAPQTLCSSEAVARRKSNPGDVSKAEKAAAANCAYYSRLARALLQASDDVGSKGDDLLPRVTWPIFLQGILKRGVHDPHWAPETELHDLCAFMPTAFVNEDLGRDDLATFAVHDSTTNERVVASSVVVSDVDSGSPTGEALWSRIPATPQPLLDLLVERYKSDFERWGYSTQPECLRVTVAT